MTSSNLTTQVAISCFPSCLARNVQRSIHPTPLNHFTWTTFPWQDFATQTNAAVFYWPRKYLTEKHVIRDEIEPGRWLPEGHLYLRLHVRHETVLSHPLLPWQILPPTDDSTIQVSSTSPKKKKNKTCIFCPSLALWPETIKILKFHSLKNTSDLNWTENQLHFIANHSMH